MAPLVVKNHVIAGVGGDLDNLPGYLRSFDPETSATAVGVGRHSSGEHAQRRRPAA